MKKVLFVLVSALLIAACASAPEAEPEEEAPAPEIASMDFSAYRQKVEDSKTKADQVKAVKGAPEKYAEAMKLYDEAQIAEASEEWETARIKFEAAAEAFEEAYTLADEKRQKALEALEEANRAISEVEKNAQAALEEAGAEGGAE